MDGMYGGAAIGGQMRTSQETVRECRRTGDSSSRHQTQANFSVHWYAWNVTRCRGREWSQYEQDGPQMSRRKW